MINAVGYSSAYFISNTYNVNTASQPSDAQIKAMKRSGAVECSTCASRTYVDGSNEADVSFKAPGHVSPQASAGAVMSHEMEHVGNAYERAGKNNGKVMQASVTLDYARCPECGRSYVAGGETVTAIKYQSNNPYSANAKAFDAANGAIGGNVDISL